MNKPAYRAFAKNFFATITEAKAAGYSLRNMYKLSETGKRYVHFDSLGSDAQATMTAEWNAA